MSKTFLFLAKTLETCSEVLGEILYSMIVHNMDLELIKERGSLGQLFYAGYFWRPCRAFPSPSVLFNKAFTLNYSVY